jgi:hypothetical protein
MNCQNFWILHLSVNPLVLLLLMGQGSGLLVMGLSLPLAPLLLGLSLPLALVLMSLGLPAPLGVDLKDH